MPLVYVPLEAVASKWYGESERLLSEVFKAAEMLPGCIIFLDEVDSLATSRYTQSVHIVMNGFCCILLGCKMKDAYDTVH